ncbi:MAG: serine/threonine-protein phosphatase [Lachnospiraceae bacterium]|nr:serine/threonine-protein phosphatase [Lachnospiraceae bacterium]
MEQKERKKHQIIFQITTRVAVFIFFIILVNSAFLFVYNMHHYLTVRFDSADSVGRIVEKEVERYRSLKFLIPYWEAHHDEMEYVYHDEDRLEEKILQLREKLPDMTEVVYVTTEEALALDEEGQRLLAEICYGKLSDAFDTYKRNYKPLYLYSFRVEGDEILFHVTGTLEEELRVRQGGDLFELGVINPYIPGAYPILDEILRTKEPASSLELSLQKGADRSVVHVFTPIYADGDLVEVVGVSAQWKDLILSSLGISLIIMLVATVLFNIVGVVTVLLLRRVVTKPITREQEIIRKYEADKDSASAVRRLKEINSQNEIETLAESFSSMVTELDRYMDSIQSAAAEKERINAELGMAASIQEGQLPRKFPAFSERTDFDIYASMDPAKEVGGDFYDFFLVDDDHLAMVIADVSGKGIPASLFMMISKVLIKNQILSGKNPGEALESANNQLIENNEADLFVTVWLAVLELSTGKGVAANAGHEHPAICRAGGQYELVKYRHSMAVAVMEEMPFPEHTFELHPGDRLFVYTDGVAEATNAHEELFGTDRMLDALNKDPQAEPKQVLKNVMEDIREFVGEAEQFDDITMLSFRYR